MSEPIRRVVGFSGGADSQAVALWVRQRFPAEHVILLRSDAGGNEHPLTDAFVEEYGRTVFPVVTVRAIVADLGDVGTKSEEIGARRAGFAESDLLTFDRLAYVKGMFPGARRQFCTEYLKMAPQRRWLETNLVAKGVPFVRYIGVRADESARRSRCSASEWDSYFACKLYRPLLAWSKADVFAFLGKHGEEANPLYRMGFARVGCAPCIYSGKEDIRLWAARAPEMIEKLRRWESQTGRQFFEAEHPGKPIDEVVAWSKTEHGGKQLSLPIVESEAESGACVSKYGLCE